MIGSAECIVYSIRSGAVVHDEFKDEGYLRQAKETLYGTFQDTRENWTISLQNPSASDMEGPPGLPYFLT